MNFKKSQINKLLLFLCINYIYSVESLSFNKDNDDNNVEGSGMNTDLLPINGQWKNPTAILEEKLNQLQENMISLINSNNNLLQKNLHTTMDEMIEKKLNLKDENKSSYNVQQLKCSNDRLPENCYELNECYNNIYSIMIPKFSNNPFPAVCDLKTLDGGWTIIQRRQDGSVNFHRNWNEYVEGFGDINGEFFIGLEKLHALTSLGEPQELYIILEDFEGESKYARYTEFKVDSNITDYKLTLGEYSGTAEDSFKYHNGQKFSTKDRDNDVSSRNCAEQKKGGWWFKDCYTCNLNGLYLKGKVSKAKEGQGVSWFHFRGYFYSLKFVQMMIRPKEN